MDYFFLDHPDPDLEPSIELFNRVPMNIEMKQKSPKISIFFI